MKKLRTGIIGCGKVGHIHARALRNISQSEFTAVCRRNYEKAKAFADQYGVKAYTDVEEMITDAKLDAVTVCTPHPVHAEGTIKAAKTGAHIIIEKPLASSIQDCDLMIQIAKGARVKLGMISQRRLYSPVMRVKKAIEEGKISSPVLGNVTMLGWRDQAYYESDTWRGTWREEGGGVLVNQAPHQLDILLWYMGPIDSLFGYWDNLNHHYIEVEDSAVAVIRFKNGALGNIMVSNSQNPALYGKVHVHGSNGSSIGVQTDGGAMFIAGMSSVTEVPYNDIWTIPGQENLKEQWNKEYKKFFKKINPMEYFHQIQIQDFLESILEDRDPMVTAEEGRQTVELFTAIYRSQRDNKPIKFPLEPEIDRNDFDGRLIKIRE